MNENPVRKNRMRSSENRRSPDHPSLSVAVPAYNEASVIASTIDRLLTFLRSTGCDFEVIVADDGSTDQTPAIVQSMRLANPELRLTTNGHNMGRGSALRHAFSSAAKRDRLRGCGSPVPSRAAAIVNRPRRERLGYRDRF